MGAVERAIAVFGEDILTLAKVVGLVSGVEWAVAHPAIMLGAVAALVVVGGGLGAAKK